MPTLCKQCLFTRNYYNYNVKTNYLKEDLPGHTKSLCGASLALALPGVGQINSLSKFKNFKNFKTFFLLLLLFEVQFSSSL